MFNRKRIQNLEYRITCLEEINSALLKEIGCEYNEGGGYLYHSYRKNSLVDKIKYIEKTIFETYMDSDVSGVRFVNYNGLNIKDLVELILKKLNLKIKFKEEQSSYKLVKNEKKRKN